VLAAEPDRRSPIVRAGREDELVRLPLAAEDGEDEDHGDNNEHKGSHGCHEQLDR